jgi:formylglycine-generating enzyme required for sulfatase activity
MTSRSPLIISKTWFIAMILLLAGCRSANVEQAAVSTLTDLPAPTQTLAPSQTQTAAPTASPTLTATTSPIPPTATPISSATLPPTFVPGSTQMATRDGMLLHYIPAGEFTMGSTDTSLGADYDEKPQHTVYLDAFWIDETEITNAMYATFLNEMGNQTEGRATWLDAADEDVLLVERDGRWQPKPGADDFPVVEVTWYGASAYCEWAGRRLPSEAEWEKAARGTDARSYPWGEEQDCANAQVANCRSVLTDVRSKPGGVGPYGVFDLSGSVWEWVADWYAEDYYAQSSASNPTGPSEGLARVLRGGSYDYNWKHARTADRRLNGPANSMNDYGFRCVLSAQE